MAMMHMQDLFSAYRKYMSQAGIFCLHPELRSVVNPVTWIFFDSNETPALESDSPVPLEDTSRLLARYDMVRPNYHPFNVEPLISIIHMCFTPATLLHKEVQCRSRFDINIGIIRRKKGSMK